MAAESPAPPIYSLRKAAQAIDPIPANAIRVDRTSPWGNPYPMRRESDRDAVCDRFERFARELLRQNPRWLEPLRGRPLVCWCRSPHNPRPKRCHAETLLRLVREVYGE